jgi:aspartate/methionine/tyrosine aminotransferase
MSHNISATLKSKMILEEYNNQNITIYNFGLGENPIQQPTYYIDRVQEFAHKKHYTRCTGIPELNTTLQTIYNTNNTKYNIIVGNGLKELIFILQLAFEGTLIHITPTWISYKEQTNILLDKHVIDFETCIDDNFSICLQKLDSLLETIHDSPKLLLFNNPNNPTGIVYQNNELQDIANILKKHNCFVFADEIYLHLCHEQNIQSISSFIPELTIIGSSVSKDLGCGGYRLGWLAFPHQITELYHKCAQYSSNIFSCASVPIQYATNYMLSNTKLYKEHYSKSNSIFSHISREMCNILRGSKLKFVEPNSAWYILIDFEAYKLGLNQLGIYNGIELSNYLLEKLQILTVAGEHFAINGLYIRFSFVDFSYIIGQSEPLDISKMIEGIQSLVMFVAKITECKIPTITV